MHWTANALPLSRLLLPMASCIILGGTLTMVGSSPMILLNDLLASLNRNLPPGAATLEPIHMFAITPIGILLLLAGLIYFLWGFDRFLPRTGKPQSVAPAKTETYFANTYGIEGEVYELRVTADSPDSSPRSAQTSRTRAPSSAASACAAAWSAR